jgi:hypothetical protein
VCVCVCVCVCAVAAVTQFPGDKLNGFCVRDKEISQCCNKPEIGESEGLLPSAQELCEHVGNSSMLRGKLQVTACRLFTSVFLSSSLHLYLIL